MTKRILLFTAFAGITALTLSSYNDGPWGPNGTNGLNRSGSAGTSASCTGSGCHSANSTTTTATVVLLSNGTPVTKYTPGATYTVAIGGSNNSANLPKYGFQLSSVRSAATSTQAGTFSGAPAGVAIRTAGSLQLVEHSSPLSGTGSGNTWVYATSLTWTAPTTGTGAVQFFMTLNAVNGNNAVSGDFPNSTSTTIPESTSGVEEIQGAFNVTAYPNPATDRVNIRMKDVANGIYTLAVYDLNGRKVATESLNVSGSSFETSLNAQAWAAGIYHIKIAKEGAEKVLTVAKQ